MADQQKNRQEAQPAFVLHSYPFRESSLLVEIFSRNFGRLPLMVRGGRRPHSTARGQLLAFQPLYLSWFGKSEVKTLHRVEWQKGLCLFEGKLLLCGFYINELLLRLLPRDDPHEQLYDMYQETLAELSTGAEQQPLLRRFEKYLLKELGYALTLDREADSGRQIIADRQYQFVIERGPLVRDAAMDGIQLSGKTLLDMAVDDYSDPLTQQESKSLMRALINHYLGEQQLHTRQLIKDLYQLS